MKAREMTHLLEDGGTVVKVQRGKKVVVALFLGYASPCFSDRVPCWQELPTKDLS